MPHHGRRRASPLLLASLLGGTLLVGVGAAILAVVISVLELGTQCGSTGGAEPLASRPRGEGQLVGATEYGGPGDPSSGTVGASGTNLVEHPDSYAELGGSTFQTAGAMGGLPYMTPLRITWGSHSAVAYKRDFGLGGGPVDGLPRVIDLWWEFASSLGIPYERGLWSGPVRVARPPDSGAANLLGQNAAAPDQLSAGAAAAADLAECVPGSETGVPLTSGERARLLPNGMAAAPADAPQPVKEMIAAGNQIAGKPYLYGGGHGLPLRAVAPAYDCSSSVEHLLYGGGLLPVSFDAPSGTLESFGAAGTGSWVTVYANPDHVFMYVAGLRWDTHNAAGSADGSAGIGWHPLVRSSDGFVPRHPVGL